MRYFEMVIADESRWHLSPARTFVDGTDVDLWAFVRCERCSDRRAIPYTINVDGKPVDYNPTAFCSTVISEKMRGVIESFAHNDVQFLEAEVPSLGNWYVLNVLRSVDCIDHNKSVIQYWPADDLEKPNQPRGILKLRIDPSRTANAHIFKPTGWLVVDIISEEMKRAFESAQITGVEYWDVTA